MNDPDKISEHNKGPIPIGEYIIYPNELNDPPWYQDIGRTYYGDWGDWRVPLHPTPGTNTFGRSGFFIHGGWISGSAGCIDIGGGWGSEETTFVKDVIIKARKPILLRVIQ